MSKSAAAIAHPNIAFIKYWGNRDDCYRLPANGSISMNLGDLYTRTTITFDEDMDEDTLWINGERASNDAEFRAIDWLTDFMEYAYVKGASHIPGCVKIESENNFPVGAGIASSAAAFAAMTVAMAGVMEVELTEEELSLRARYGSGSACRSIPEGFCEWDYGSSNEDSVAFSLAPASHWDLVDLIAVVSGTHKKVGSSHGHMSAFTSPFQRERIRTAPQRIAVCRQAILEKDFESLAEVSEKDMIMMHSVMMTQNPPLFYWEPTSLEIMKAVHEWYEDGLDCFTTVDAGPNVHVICTADSEAEVKSRLDKIAGIQMILRSGPGGGAHLV